VLPPRYFAGYFLDGWWMDHTGRTPDELYRELARTWPQDIDYQAGAAQVSFNQGWLALQQDRADEARCSLQTAIQHEHAALRISSGGDNYRRELSKQYRFLARALRLLKDVPGAAEAEAAANRYKLPSNPQRQGQR